MIKVNWHIEEDDIFHTCETVGEAGVGLVLKTGASGAAFNEKAGEYEVPTSASGKIFVGILLHDVVDIDLTKYHLNFQKHETQKGDPCWVLRKGWVDTDMIVGSPTEEQTAYLTTNGEFTPTVSSTGGEAATPKVGKFRTGVDENGVARVEVNLPIV